MTKNFHLTVLLKNHNVEFKEKKITEDGFETFKTNFKKTTLPQLYVDGNSIGGYDDCRELVKPEFDYKLLHKITKVVTRNLNNVIDPCF